MESQEISRMEPEKNSPENYHGYSKNGPSSGEMLIFGSENVLTFNITCLKNISLEMLPIMPVKTEGS